MREISPFPLPTALGSISGDLDVYSKMADRLESRVKLTNNKDLQQEAEEEIEKIVSNFKNAPLVWRRRKDLNL